MQGINYLHNNLTFGELKAIIQAMARPLNFEVGRLTTYTQTVLS